jgi:redox-sensitive bicupin YhaK (pirin superfamily)
LASGASTVSLHREWEYALVVLRGAVRLGDRAIEPGRLAYLGEGRDEVVLQAAEPTRAILLGGEPFAEDILMWWNFVSRSREEINTAYASWQRQDDRFGRVRSTLPRIPVSAPYWLQAAGRS